MHVGAQVKCLLPTDHVCSGDALITLREKRLLTITSPDAPFPEVTRQRICVDKSCAFLAAPG